MAFDSPDQHGHAVVLIARGDHLRAIVRSGLRIESPDSETTVRIPAVESPSSIEFEPGDVVMLSVKGQDSATALRTLAGVTTEVCVQTTMREANDRGFDCLLVEDATESYFPEFKAATLAMIRAQGGIVGWTATTDQVLEAMRG